MGDGMWFWASGTRQVPGVGVISDIRGDVPEWEGLCGADGGTA